MFFLSRQSYTISVIIKTARYVRLTCFVRVSKKIDSLNPRYSPISSVLPCICDMRDLSFVPAFLRSLHTVPIIVTGWLSLPSLINSNESLACSINILLEMQGLSAKVLLSPHILQSAVCCRWHRRYIQTFRRNRTKTGTIQINPSKQLIFCHTYIIIYTLLKIEDMPLLYILYHNQRKIALFP